MCLSRSVFPCCKAGGGHPWSCGLGIEGGGKPEAMQCYSSFGGDVRDVREIIGTETLGDGGGGSGMSRKNENKFCVENKRKTKC